jgi:ABC-2 type transport system permease protein
VTTALRHGLLLARFEFVDYTRSVGAFAYAILTPALVLILVAELWVPDGSRSDLVAEVVGMAILATGIFSIGVAVTEERRDGTLKTFMASPIGFVSYLIGHILSRVTALIVGIVVMLAVAVAMYDVAPARSWPLFLAVAALSTATMLALGFLLASRSQRTESAGAIGSLLFIVGIVTVSIEPGSIPPVASSLLDVLPFGAMSEALRASWSGDGVAEIAGDASLLVGWLVVMTAAASRWFRWSLSRS